MKIVLPMVRASGRSMWVSAAMGGASYGCRLTAPEGDQD
jgi:hypothetical protein